MATVNQTRPGATNKSLEMDIERNVQESLLRKVYETSTCEINNQSASFADCARH